MNESRSKYICLLRGSEQVRRKCREFQASDAEARLNAPRRGGVSEDAPRLGEGPEKLQRTFHLSIAEARLNAPRCGGVSAGAPRLGGSAEQPKTPEMAKSSNQTPSNLLLTPKPA